MKKAKAQKTSLLEVEASEVRECHFLTKSKTVPLCYV
jgi:hypothetical protein